ncbi:MAG: MBL fold metallo-hydrolase [Candidatus Woesearchaeota archaeon]
MKAEKVAVGIWKFFKGPGLSSNVYFIEPSTLVDLGSRENSGLLKARLSSLGYKASDIKKIIYTHFHYDHVGNPKDFPNAKFYASKEEIEDLKKKKYLAVFSFKAFLSIRKLKILPIKGSKELEVIKTPGHTRGSICLFHKKNKILFSGDTLFDFGTIGRTDLPTSVPEKMGESLRKLEKYKYKKLCPGH